MGIRNQMNPALTAAIPVILMVLWVVFLFESRREMCRSERLSYDYLFKWNVLPLMIAMELLTTHNLMVLGLGALAFVLCWPIAKFAVLAAPLITGWHVGAEWFSKVYTQADHRVCLGALTVALVMTLMIQVVIAVLRRPPRHT